MDDPHLSLFFRRRGLIFSQLDGCPVVSLKDPLITEAPRPNKG
ncbi:MAG: hypothetical protein ACI9RZ_001669 [Sphingobacteriales bacterium]|jgi:hypothetical protein